MQKYFDKEILLGGKLDLASEKIKQIPWIVFYHHGIWNLS